MFSFTTYKVSYLDTDRVRRIMFRMGSIHAWDNG